MDNYQPLAQPASFNQPPNQNNGFNPANNNSGFIPQENSGFTQKEVKSISLGAWLKLGYIVGFITLSLAGAFFFAKKISAKTGGKGGKDVLMTTKYQPVLWKDFGNVFEPLIKVPVYYPKNGYKKEKFLLDSGAVVSSLPREKAKELGFLLSRLPRSSFSGFGGTTSFAYKGNLKIKLGSQEATIPVVFTEAQGTKAILGRSGFFENYSVYFNSKDEKIEIRK